MAKFIVIHSGEDRDLADLFSRFLRDTLFLEEGELVLVDCDNDQKNYNGDTPPESGFIPTIKRTLADCRAVMILFSQAFVDSRSCILELGSVWSLCQNVYPLYISPIREDYECTALGELPVRSLSDLTDLRNLLHDLRLLDCRYGISEDFEENISRFRDEAVTLLFRKYGGDFRPIITHIT